MENKEKVLAAMKQAGEPLNASKTAYMLQARSFFYSEYYFKALYMMLITSALLMVFFGENLFRSVAPMIPLT